MIHDVPVAWSNVSPMRNLVREVSKPISLGIEPDMVLFFKLKSFKFVRDWISLGIVPLRRRLELIRSDVN